MYQIYKKLFSSNTKEIKTKTRTNTKYHSVSWAYREPKRPSADQGRGESPQEVRQDIFISPYGTVLGALWVYLRSPNLGRAFRRGLDLRDEC